jgi:hypothetical protein
MRRSPSDDGLFLIPVVLAELHEMLAGLTMSGTRLELAGFSDPFRSIGPTIHLK